MEIRFMIAFALTGLVLLATQFLYKPAQPQPATPNKQPETAAAVAPKAAAPTAVAPAPATAELPGQVSASQEESFIVDTDRYRVTFSNRGGVVRSWILKDYKDTSGKPLELVNLRALAKVPAPFSLVFKSQLPANDPNQALFRVEHSPDNLGITFRYSDGRAIPSR